MTLDTKIVLLCQVTFICPGRTGGPGPLLQGVKQVRRSCSAPSPGASALCDFPDELDGIHSEHLDFPDRVLAHNHSCTFGMELFWDKVPGSPESPWGQNSRSPTPARDCFRAANMQPQPADLETGSTCWKIKGDPRYDFDIFSHFRPFISFPWLWTSSHPVVVRPLKSTMDDDYIDISGQWQVPKTQTVFWS